jgi:hypothetical protein
MGLLMAACQMEGEDERGCGVRVGSPVGSVRSVSKKGTDVKKSSNERQKTKSTPQNTATMNY